MINTEKLRAVIAKATPRAKRTFTIGQRVEKISGSSWRGRVVGYYSTALTPDGVCIESENEPGSVQLYPSKAMRALASEASHD